MNIFLEIVGWSGTFLIVLAFYLVSNNKLNASSWKAQLLNILGAFFTGINVFYHHAWPSFALQVIWIIIPVLAFLNKKLK